MKRFNKHIFICENQRPPEHPTGCCKAKGSSEILQLFKSRVRELGLLADIRVNSSGCLDACKYGVSMVIYPEQIWYGGVTRDDVEEIINSHLLNDKPVERLKITDPGYNRDAS